MTFVRYATYEGTYLPREDETHKLKPSARPFVGRRLKLIYVGVIDGDRPLFAGEHEFTIHGDEPNAEGLPVWFSERDLRDIERTNT